MLVSALPGSSAGDDAGPARRRAGGLFLRGKREALAPQRVGIRPNARRRTPGLLREEVAQRAGVSLTWYTWLEQGRDVRPSPALLMRIGDALLLDAAERDYVRQLWSGDATAALTEEVPAAVVQLIEGLAAQPAYALNGAWNFLAWNAAAVDLIGDLSKVPAQERNLLHMMFLYPAWRTLFADWTTLAASVVAQFRLAWALYGHCPRTQTLHAGLMRDSDEFRDLWQRDEIAAGDIKTKRFKHPRRGDFSLTYAAMHPQGAPSDVVVTIYATLP